VYRGHERLVQAAVVAGRLVLAQDLVLPNLDVGELGDTDHAVYRMSVPASGGLGEVLHREAVTGNYGWYILSGTVRGFATNVEKSGLSKYSHYIFGGCPR